MIATDEAVYKLPRQTARPGHVITDVDAVIPDTGDAQFDTVDIAPVVVAARTEVANSLNFARNPNAVALVSQSITNAILEGIDEAIITGYTTGTGATWGGLVATATATGLPVLTNASTAAQWRRVTEFMMAAMKTTDLRGMRWLSNPAVVSMLASAPPFAGATVAMASMSGAAPMFGAEWVETLKLPVVASQSEVLLGDFSSITAVAFNSASIELVANPYETNAFAKGSTLLRAIASIGVGQSDAARLCKTTVTA
jgi:HK97 family phage major capsid protein